MAQYSLVGYGPESPCKEHHDHSCSMSDEDTFPETGQDSHLPKPFYRQHNKVIVLHSLLCAFNLFFYLAVWQWARKDCPFGA